MIPAPPRISAPPRIPPRRGPHHVPRPARTPARFVPALATHPEAATPSALARNPSQG
jgi:hypothetical protein